MVAVTVTEPEVVWFPDHAPEAVHDVALTADHVSWLSEDESVFAAMLTTGASDAVAPAALPSPPHAESSNAASRMEPHRKDWRLHIILSARGDGNFRVELVAAGCVPVV